MDVSSQAVANRFIELAKAQGMFLTNMQLQKLVFIAQGYALALLGHRLYYHNTHAWQFGPVIPKLYKSLQKYGRGAVTEKLDSDDELPSDSPEMEIVSGVLKAYGHMSGSQLSALTHNPGTPWSLTWEKDKFGIIPEDVIAEHYKKIAVAA